MRNSSVAHDHHAHDHATMTTSPGKQPAFPPVAEAILRLVTNDFQARNTIERRHSRSSSRTSSDSFLDDDLYANNPNGAGNGNPTSQVFGPAPTWPPPVTTPPSSPPSSFSFSTPHSHRRDSVHVRHPSDPFDLISAHNNTGALSNPNELPFPIEQRKWNPPTPRKRPSSRGSSVGWQPLTLSPASSLGPASPAGSVLSDALFNMPNPSTFALSQPGMATGPHSPNGSLRGFTASGSGSAQSSLHGHGHSRSAQSSIHGHHRYSTDFNVAPMSMSMSMPRCIGRAQSGNRNTRPSLDMPFRPNHNASGPGAGGLVSEFGRLSLNGVVGNGSLNLDGFGNPNLQDSRSGFNGRASQSQGHAHVNNLNIDMPSPNSSLDFSNGGSVDYGHGNGTVNLNMNGLDYGRGSQSLDFGVGMHGQMQMLNFDSGRGSSLDLQGAGAAFDPAPGRRPLLNTAFSLSAGSSLSGPVSPTSSGDSSAFKTCIFCDTELHEGISLHNKLRHPFACQICRTDIASQRELDDHNIAVHGRNVPCSDCGRAFAKHHHLAQHMRDAHKYPCPRCNKIANSRAAFDAHVKDKHPHLVGRVQPVALPVAQTQQQQQPQGLKPLLDLPPNPNAGILPTMGAVLGRLRGTKRGGAGKRRV